MIVYAVLRMVFHTELYMIFRAFYNYLLTTNKNTI